MLPTEDSRDELSTQGHPDPVFFRDWLLQQAFRISIVKGNMSSHTRYNVMIGTSPRALQKDDIKMMPRAIISETNTTKK